MANFVRRTEASRAVYVAIDNIAGIIQQNGEYTVHLKTPIGTVSSVKVESEADIAILHTILTADVRV